MKALAFAGELVGALGKDGIGECYSGMRPAGDMSLITPVSLIDEEIMVHVAYMHVCTIRSEDGQSNSDGIVK